MSKGNDKSQKGLIGNIIIKAKNLILMAKTATNKQRNKTNNSNFNFVIFKKSLINNFDFLLIITKLIIDARKYKAIISTRGTINVKGVAER